MPTCQYIAGDPHLDPSRCGRPSLPGYSYCPEHARLCHIPLGSPEEEHELNKLGMFARHKGKATPHYIPNEFFSIGARNVA